jgi:hypothetical protein
MIQMLTSLTNSRLNAFDGTVTNDILPSLVATQLKNMSIFSKIEKDCKIKIIKINNYTTQNMNKRDRYVTIAPLLEN